MKSPKAKKRSRKAAKKLNKPEDAEEATDAVTTFAPQEAPQPMPVVTTQPQANLAATSARSEAARRTAEGKFTKAVFNQIGGTEYPRFASATWKQRDAFMALAEGAPVKQRYEAHLASLQSES